jgi:hypothetical protein
MAGRSSDSEAGASLWIIEHEAVQQMATMKAVQVPKPGGANND